MSLMLTKRRKEVLDFMKTYLKKNGYSPSLQEIQKKLNLASVSTAHFHVSRLKDEGYITKQNGKARSIEANDMGSMIKIPLLGYISAGQPIEAIEDRTQMIAFPANRVPTTASLFALTVQGNSMIDENIYDGDVIIVKEQNTAKNGEAVVAFIDNESATVKKFYRERRQIRLQPANDSFEPIIIKRNQDLKIQGVVVDVIKTNEAKQTVQTFVLPVKKNVQQKGKISDYLNKVYNGDVMHVLKDLPDNSVDMIFGDPDYNVGIRYGENNYTRKFEDYINWYIELTKESMRVLKNDGNLFMMNYPQQNAHLRVKYLDLHFPNIHEYVWVYNTNVGHTPRRFTTAHRSILHVRKDAGNKFFKDDVALPYKNPTDKRIQQNLANGSKGRMPYSWFEFNLVKNVSKEKTLHACQIPQKLTEMLIKASTKPKDIVFTLFGGSGAEIDVCRNLNRQFISAEIDKKYCNIINDRLTKGYIDNEHKLFQGRKRRVEIKNQVTEVERFQICL